MAITDLQSWAENLEVLRLPAIESDIDLLQTQQGETSGLLSAKSQEFNDRLNAHTVRIDVNQTGIVVADDRSMDALTRVYDAELQAKAYTDAAAQNLRDKITAEVEAAKLALEQSILATLGADLDGTLANYDISFAAQIAEIDARMAQIDADRAAFDTVTDDILNQTVPMLELTQGGLNNDITNLRGIVTTHLTDFTEASLRQGLDNVLTSTGAEISALRTELTADIASVSAVLQVDYYTIAATDQAISLATTTLKSQMEAPTGSIGSLSATLTNDYLTTVDTNAAIAVARTALEADINGLSANVTTQSTAISNLEGNASAGFLIKAQAGSSVSLFDLIAADGSAGSVSVARVSAQTILLDGTVYAQHLAADSVTADKISVISLAAVSGTLGLFRSATTGARVEIQDDKISVYRANGTLAVRIGNLA